MSATIDKIIEETKGLTPDELQRLRATVDALLVETEGPPMTEDEFEGQLAAEGFASIPDRAAEPNLESEDYEPITVTGKPLSEMIIEERR